MQARDVWKAVAIDRSNFRDNLVDMLAKHSIHYCVIGGQGVNAYTEPLIDLDFELVVAVNQIELLESLMRSRFKVERIPNSLNVPAEGSDSRVQIQTDPRYFGFPARADIRSVLGIPLPVARIEDLLQGKIWAALDPKRRPSKKRKDLLDIERLVEANPELNSRLPEEIPERLS